MALSAFAMHLSLHFPDIQIGRNRFYRHVRYFIGGIEILRIEYPELVAGVQELDWINDRLREADKNYSAGLADKLLETL